MSGPEPLPTEARLYGWLFIVFIAFAYSVTLYARREARSPAGSVPCDAGKIQLNPI